MPKLDFEKQCETRSKGGYIPFKYKNDKFNNLFFLNTAKLWKSLQKNIQFKGIGGFKTYLKKLGLSCAKLRTSLGKIGSAIFRN